MGALRRKIMTGIAVVALALVGAVAVAAPASAAEYTATITSSKAYFRTCEAEGCQLAYTKVKGEKEILTCQVTNSVGNVWFKTRVYNRLNWKYAVYSGHFNSAYKSILPKC